MHISILMSSQKEIMFDILRSPRSVFTTQSLTMMIGMERVSLSSLMHRLVRQGMLLNPRRGIFDCWFFLSRHTAVNEHIVRERTGLSVAEYAAHCAGQVRTSSPKLLMQGLGEVIDAKTKTFVRTRLIDDTATALELFSAFPLIAESSKHKGTL